MAKKPKFKIGNQVHVKGSSKDPTFYKIVEIFPNGRCYIREEGTAPNGKPYARQLWDLSLLRHAVSDQMLKAFSLGPLKAFR